MQAPRPSPIHLAAAAVITVTALLPYWITISMGRGATLDAGLWGTSRARWDDMRVDLDIFGPAYLALAASLVGAVLLVRAATGGQPERWALARKGLIATLVLMVLFMGRMLIENGVGVGWAGVVGPLAAGAAIASLPRK